MLNLIVYVDSVSFRLGTSELSQTRVHGLIQMSSSGWVRNILFSLLRFFEVAYKSFERGRLFALTNVNDGSKRTPTTTNI